MFKRSATHPHEADATNFARAHLAIKAGVGLE